jgi:2-polyprenyl-3-methyl-5-hydroxy-6-metoxy-1,4-benzoquinol methylase
MKPNRMKSIRKTLVQMFVLLAPPVVATGVRRVRDRLLGRKPPRPEDYSVLDGPQQVPCQVESYLFCRDKYLRPDDSVLDVGFGLGYGMHIMAGKARNIAGVEVDERAMEHGRRVFEGHPFVKELLAYDGRRLPFDDNSFDVITCVEVMEHVRDYNALLLEMVRVAKRLVFITTPNRRAENTLPNGRPRNPWHLREWSKREFDAILGKLHLKHEWNMLNGPFDGPFTWSSGLKADTFSLVPVVLTADTSADDADADDADANGTP